MKKQIRFRLSLKFHLLKVMKSEKLMLEAVIHFLRQKKEKSSHVDLIFVANFSKTADQVKMFSHQKKRQLQVILHSALQDAILV